MSRQIQERIEGILRKDGLVVTPPFPKEVMIELSNVCNHRCNFCAISKSTRDKGFAETPMMEGIVSEARSLGAEVISFHSGAEPFVSPDLEHFIEYAKSLSYSYIYVTTNGSLATPERLSKAFDAGLDSIKFSVNAGTQEVYEQIHGRNHFERVLSHIRFATRYREEKGLAVYIGVSFVETRENAHTFDSLKALLEDDVDEIVHYPVANQSGQMPGISELSIMDGAPCSLPFKRLHVSREGYVRLCCADYQNNLALSDLRDKGLEEAFYSEAFQEMRRRHLEDRLQGTLCHNCIHNTNDPIEPLNPELATPNPDGFMDFHPSLEAFTPETVG